MAAEPAPAGFAEDVLAMLPRLSAYARFLARDPPAADDLVPLHRGFDGLGWTEDRQALGRH